MTHAAIISKMAARTASISKAIIANRKVTVTATVKPTFTAVRCSTSVSMGRSSTYRCHGAR